MVGFKRSKQLGVAMRMQGSVLDGAVLGASPSRRIHKRPAAAAMLLAVSLVAMFAGIGTPTAVAGEKMTEYFQEQGSSPLDIVAGAEGGLWYTGGVAPGGCLAGAARLIPPGGITRIGLGCEGEQTEREAFVGAGAHSIALGPDDNLWFTAGGGVGMSKPAATAAEDSEDFLLPVVKEAFSKKEVPPVTGLGGIATGPEHENLWFTEVENNTSKIGRIDPTTHVITEFALPAGNNLDGGVGTTIDDIAAGPNETLWFTEPGSHAIGIVNTKGEFLEQIILRQTDDPQSIAAGPDGNMWFTDAGTLDAIGRINPAAEVSEFPAPSVPASIVAGPDGNMWFTEDGAGEEAGVGCIIPTGQIELQHEQTPGGEPEGITVNQDGSIWFTERLAERLSRLSPVDCGAKPLAITPPPNSGATTTPGSGATTTTTPTSPPKGGTTAKQPLATVLGLPSAQQCVSKRTLIVHVHAPPGQQLLSVKLSLRGRVLRAETFTKGTNHRVPPTLVDLRGLPKGTFTLTIVVKTKQGKTYRATRTYHTCVPGKHKKSK
jgi:virginiamycin B lyase